MRSENTAPLPQKLDADHLWQVLQTEKVTEQHLMILRWLVWLSLLSTWELERLLGKDSKTVWGYLDQLIELGLIHVIVLHESGWPRRHHRYYITDLGLYVLAALHPQPLSAQKLASSYPVTAADLTERLTRPYVHLVLSDLVTRLLAEHPANLHLTSYQQPYKERYRGGRDAATHMLLFDAAFLLETAPDTRHAFYVHVDQPEHLLSQPEVRTFIKKLLALRQSMHLSGETMPHFLLVSSQERFSFWAEQMHRATLEQGIMLLNSSKPERVRAHMDLSCAIVDRTHLTNGAYVPIWTPFHALIEQDGVLCQETLMSLDAFLERSASARLVERFSQYFNLQQALLQCEAPSLSRHRKSLTRYVALTLHDEAAPIITQARPAMKPPQFRHIFPLINQISATLHSDREDRRYMSSLLTLALSNQQKDILTYLVRHPYLTCSDILMLLHPGSQDERLVLRQMRPLINLGLVNVFLWKEAHIWRERERYYVREPALRYLAMRHGLSPAYYLKPLYKADQDKGQHTISPLATDIIWVHSGAKLLRDQLAHTNGLYRCIRTILAHAHRNKTYRIIYWKSAREAVRQYQDPLARFSSEIRPDAELFYTVDKESTPRPLLLEYDRSTTYAREYRRKMRCYTDYQYATRSTLPPLLIITQNTHTIRTIQQAIAQEHAFDVPVLFLLETQILQEGLFPLLDQLR